MAKEINEQVEKLTRAYHQMVEQSQEILKESVEGAVPSMRNMINTAKKNAIELGELSQEEAEKVGDYLRRDLHDAADYLQESKKDFKDWLRFDVELVEARLAEMFSHVIDHTRIELDKLAMKAEMAEWHTGEITSPGTLHCIACEKELHFHKVGHIPPCSGCRGTRFKRVRE